MDTQSYEYRHKDEQEDVIYLISNKTGWTGQQYAEMWTDARCEWYHDQRLGIFNNVCRSLGHDLVVEEEFDGWQFVSCTRCGGCNEPECCPDFQLPL